jgi:hypothetical protein
MEIFKKYKPRKFSESLLYQTVSQNIGTFFGALESNSEQKSLPQFVKREFEKFLTCGNPEYGLTRVKCNDNECKSSVWVPTSCKTRGFCPSCGSRRMNVAAINLTEKVLPWVPIRQWVISLPFPLRFWIAADFQLMKLVNDTIFRVIEKYIKEKALKQGISNCHTGAISFIQRWGGSLNLNPHFHIIFLNGVFQTYDTDDKEPVFIKASPIQEHEALEVVKNICQEVTAILINRGYLENVDDEISEVISENSVDRDTFLNFCKNASVYSRIALGPRAGSKVRKIGVNEFYNTESSGENTGECCAKYGGFSLHANTWFQTNQREELKSLIRYVARSSVSLERLSETDEGNIKYELKSPWSDGTTAVLFSKLEFLEKLASLVPYPHKNLIVYFGCLAPHHKIRSQIVPISKDDEDSEEASDQRDIEDKSRYISWRDLLKKTWEIDLFICQKCGGETSVIAFVTNSLELRKIIDNAGLLARPPPDKFLDNKKTIYEDVLEELPEQWNSFV